MIKRFVECLNGKTFYRLTKIHGCRNMLQTSSQEDVGTYVHAVGTLGRCVAKEKEFDFQMASVCFTFLEIVSE